MKHLKLFFALFAMLALGVTNAWAESVEFTSSNCTNWTTSQVEQSQTINGITLHTTKGANTSSQLRLYADATHTISSTVGNITSIVFTCTANGAANYGPGKMTGDGYVASSGKTGEWTGNAASVTLKGGQSRCTSIVVTYTPSSGGTEPPTPAKTYDVTWMVNGEEWAISEDVEENTQITTLPAEPTDKCAGKVFQGWTDKEITDGQKPAILFKDKSPEITEELTTFYAVFATVPAGGGAGGSITISSETENFPTAYGTANAFTEYTLEGYKFKIQQVYINGGKLQWRASGNKNGTGTMYNTQKFPANIASIVVVFDASDDKKNHTVKVGATENPTSGTSISPSISGSTYTFDCSGGSYDYFVLTNGANAGYVSSITINYGSVATPSDYTTSCSGSTEPVVSLTDEQLKWSAATATALKGADNNEFPILTNELSVPITYTSSNTSVTIAADGKITLLAPGTTTISASFAGGEVSGTKYAAKTVTYTLTVKQLVSCADIYDLADEATFVLKDFVVTYVNGKYTYIKDGTGYGLIFNNAGDYGLKAGDKVASGKFEGKRDTYNGLVEIIPTTTAADLNATPGTAPEPEVVTNTPTNADINKYVKFEDVSFKYTNLNDTYKTNSGKLEGQTEYNITFYNKFTSNVTFDTSKKYDVVGVVSIKDDAIEVYFISAEEVEEPTLNVKITNADFGKIAINDDAERTLTLNGSRLTNTVSLAIEGEGAEHFKLSSNSVDPTDGNITNAKITITYKPATEDTHTATLKITSDGVAEQTITLIGQAAQEYTIHFYVNGEEDETLKKTVLSGNTLEELPEATSCDQINYPTFAGWASDAIDGTTDVKPTMLDKSTPITRECNYYAVFEKRTISSGSATSAIMQYTGGTTTNMEDGNNATIVGLDETLFNITSTKTASGTHVGLNKNNDIRLYANKSDGNGNILMISMLDGSSITKITLDIKQEATFVVKANGKSITGADNVYTIDYPSCSIQNTTTGATTQLHLNSITIEYTTSTTTYEYITSCAKVVQTCEIKYDYASGEGECTNAIVEEGSEYTLCATAPTKAGHTFLNWKDQNGVEYAEGATINSVTEDLTLTAQWQVNSYEVTWMSLGEEVASNSANHDTQPAKPTTDLTYPCGTGKEFVGWTTQEIDGVGVPANLYTDEFPVVTEAITYYAVFASKIEGGGSMSRAVSLTNGETIYLATESGIGVTGAVAEGKDAIVSTTQGDWMQFTVVTNGLQYQFKNGDNYITAAAKSFKITATPSDFAFENGYIVYNVPSGSDTGDYVLLYNSNSGSFYRFYKKSNIGKANYETFYVYKNPTHTDYTTSCPEPVALGEGDNSEIINAGGTIDVKVNRNFVANTLYTLSLPFAMNNVAEIFGAGTILYKYSSLTMVGGELEIGFDKVNSIEAGTPYLIEPAQAVDGFTAEDVTIINTQTPIIFTADGNTLTMKPVLTATTGAKTNGEYWLASNRYLYNTQTNLLSLRAVFELVVPSGSAVPRARVVFNQNTATGMENVDASAQPVKTIINGQLYILRGEKMYDAQGKLVK